LKLLDTLYDSLKKSAGCITVEEFHDTVLGMNSEEEKSYHLVASIIAMDGRFIFDGDKIKLRPAKNSKSNLKHVSDETAIKRLSSSSHRIDETKFERILNYHIMDAEYCVIDFETTGFSANLHRVIEIGAVKIKGAKVVDRFQTFVNSVSYVPSFITNLTGINAGMLKNAPDAVSAFSDLYKFVDDSIIVAHNLAFDEKFLRKNFETHGFPMPEIGICTMKLARRFLKEEGISNMKLPSVAKFFSINIERGHRALDDAQVTAEIFLNFLEIAERSGLERVSKLYEFQTNPIDSI